MVNRFFKLDSFHDLPVDVKEFFSQNAVSADVIIRQNVGPVPTSNVLLIRQDTSFQFVLKIYHQNNSISKECARRETIIFSLLPDSFRPEIYCLESRHILMKYYQQGYSKHRLTDLGVLIGRLHEYFHSNRHQLMKCLGQIPFNFFGTPENFIQNALIDLPPAIQGFDISKKQLFQALKSAICPLLQIQSKTLVHGDMCNNNILWCRPLKLIDFECISHLPPEFDLSVFFDTVLVKKTSDLESALDVYLEHTPHYKDLKSQTLLQCLVFDSLRRYRFNQHCQPNSRMARFYFRRLCGSLVLLKLIGRTQVESLVDERTIDFLEAGIQVISA